MNNTHIPKILLALVIILAVAVLGLLVFIASFTIDEDRAILKPPANTTPTSTPTTDTTTPDTTPPDTVIADPTPVTTDTTPIDTVTADITWLAEPEPLEDLGLLQNSAGYDYYFTVASLADGGEIIYMYREELGKAVHRFRKHADGSYVLLANHSASYLADHSTDYLSAGVTVDTTTEYPELYYPETLTVNHLPLSLYTYGLVSYSLESNLTAEDQAALVEFGDTDYGTVYQLPAELETTYDNGSIVGKKYLLILADHSVVSYADTFAFLGDDSSVQADWADDYADFADRQFMTGIVVNGCGVQGGNQYAADITPKLLEVVGSTTAGEPLYTVLDGDNALLRNAYESYKVGRDYEGSTVELLSYDDFVAATPVLLWQDAAGDYILFMDQTYAPAVECGKPLLYLYPTQPTQVSVEVAADITKSEPAYHNGWKVLAQPSGTELYWEGKGLGSYPKITAGTVVARAAVEQTIRQDLAALGLQSKEIQDFLDFWMPHMPNTPYVRLTWFNTAQMNQLAPLRITPRPDTLIRVFLDFAGQSTAATTLPPQTLTTLPRTGFTVIEWGGLLLGQ